MQEHKHERVVQIMPAQGWVAVYAGHSNGAPVFSVPLTCWALVESDCWDARCPEKRGDVYGLIAEECVETCEADENFLGYARVTEDLIKRYGKAALSLMSGRDLSGFLKPEVK